MNSAATLNALMPVTPRPDIVFTRGSGARLFDADGRSYLDWVQGWAVNSLGHAPDELVSALAQQAVQLINPGPAFYNQPALDLAAWLVAHTCFDQVFFTSSGAEANEGAIKLARKWGQLHKGGAHEIITFHNSFHGRTLATMAATGKAGWDQLFAPAMPGFVKADYNDLESVRERIGPRTVAVMLEPIQGEAGVIPAAEGFLAALRTLCDEHGLLLIVDEVQTGCGRTGTLFAHEQAGIQPDIMTLGKGIGGGVPLGALLARNSVACFAYGDQGGTYCGNPLMCAAGLAVMEKIGAPGFLAHVQAMSKLLLAGLQQISQQFGLRAARGQGLLLALDLGRDIAAEVVSAARTQGFLLNAPRPHLLRFMPPLNSTAAELDEGLTRLAAVLTEVCANQISGPKHTA
ncbi:MAG: acetylornithine transaminase [Uliginosibacterium sp.]|nr:acetylornithine transaminase [Uliginosibacterium sp.]MBK9613968.1 acetylornithine transaminase [Uliginosibacterium sp.]